MICFLALIVFGVLGIFSASHRQFAKEAFDCVFKRVTLRKCTTGFDKKMKMKISTKLLKKSPRAGKFVFKHFEAISWIFTVILMASFIYSAYSIYNLVVFGTCDPEQPDQCIFTGLNKSVCNEKTCTGEECIEPEFGVCGEGCDCNIETGECRENQ